MKNPNRTLHRSFDHSTLCDLLMRDGDGVKQVALAMVQDPEGGRNIGLVLLEACGFGHLASRLAMRPNR
jgi:hypothetical protein